MAPHELPASASSTSCAVSDEELVDLTDEVSGVVTEPVQAAVFIASGPSCFSSLSLSLSLSTQDMGVIDLTDSVRY